MKILVASTPIVGHLNPLLSITEILISDGHDVAGLSSEVFCDQFTQRGALFYPMQGNAGRDLRDVDRVFPERKKMPPGPGLFYYTHRKIFIEPLIEQSTRLREVLRIFPADIIVADSSFFGTLPLLLSSEPRPAIVHCGITILQSSRDDRAPYGAGLPPATTDDERVRYREIATRFDVEALHPLRELRDRLLNGQGLPTTPLGLFDAQVNLPDAYIQLTVPSFEYPRATLPSSVAFVGQPPPATSRHDLPEWAGDLDGEHKIVLVTQGTVTNHDLGQLIGPTLEAFAKAKNIIVVATTGGRSFDAIPGTIPSNARLAHFIPYDWLMPKIDVLVTNGGYGTVNYALRHGIPMIVAGLTEDKADVAARVAWSGVGINLASTKPSASALHAAVHTVLDSTEYRQRALAFKNEFARYDTRSEILKIFRDVISTTKPHTSGHQRTNLSSS